MTVPPGTWGQQQPGWGQQPPPPRRGRTGLIALITVVVGLLCAAGVVFLVFGDDFDLMGDLLKPAGASGPGGTVDLGQGVSVTAPDGWSIGAREGDSFKLGRGRSMVLAGASAGRTRDPAERCDTFVRNMAGRSMTDPTFSDPVTVKTSDGATAVLCEVTGTATGGFGSGPSGIRVVVASAADVTAKLSLYYHPGSTKDETLQDFGAMADSLWESLLD